MANLYCVSRAHRSLHIPPQPRLSEDTDRTQALLTDWLRAPVPSSTCPPAPHAPTSGLPASQCRKASMSIPNRLTPGRPWTLVCPFVFAFLGERGRQRVHRHEGSHQVVCDPHRPRLRTTYRWVLRWRAGVSWALFCRLGCFCVAMSQRKQRTRSAVRRGRTADSPLTFRRATTRALRLHVRCQRRGDLTQSRHRGASPEGVRRDRQSVSTAPRL